jgi:RecA-family ATPase
MTFSDDDGGVLSVARELYAEAYPGKNWDEEDPEVQRTLVHLAQVRVRPLGRDEVARVVQLQLWITFRQLMQAVERGRFTEKQVRDDLAGRMLLDEWHAFRLLPPDVDEHDQ